MLNISNNLGYTLYMYILFQGNTILREFKLNRCLEVTLLSFPYESNKVIEEECSTETV